MPPRAAILRREMSPDGVAKYLRGVLAALNMKYFFELSMTPREHGVSQLVAYLLVVW
jgi:hypothetical protein